MSSPVALNLNPAEIEQAGALLTSLLRDYEASLSSRKVLPALDRSALSALLEEDFPALGQGIEHVFDEIAHTVIPNSTAIAHPRFLAYVQGPPNGIAPFAEAIAAALNQNCNIWQLSPVASVIERKVVSWLAGLFGFPAGAGGLFTSGGSMATLMALAAAVHDKCPDYRNTGLQGLNAPLVIYTSEEAHRCVEKAAAILGIGLNHVRRIPVDTQFKMCTDALRTAVDADKAAGRRPVCVVATSGTVNTGSIDPVDEIAILCAQENMWLHVDGAFGALFVLSDKMRNALQVCGKADSIALDPHKLLFAPLEAGCLVVRDPQKLKHAFSFNASYIIGSEPDPLLTNYLDYGAQLSRGFKAFKVWCALKTFGVQAFVDASNRMVALAQHMAQRIQCEPDLELLAPVTLSAVCWRVRRLDDGENAAVLQKLIAEGSALLGPVRLHGRAGLRACITNYRTRAEDLDWVVERVLELAK